MCTTTSDQLATDPAELSSLLLYGSSESRRTVAAAILGDGPEALAMLVSTIFSDEPWPLRARCLEVLGLVAGQAPRQTAERILADLTEAAKL